MSDTNFIREVEEEVRREKLKKIWDTYGVYILLGAFSIVAIVAGTKFWEYWKTSQAESAGSRFVNAELLATEGKEDGARAEFERLVEEGPGGYPMLAKLKLAAGALANDKPDEALKIYDEIAKTSGGDALLNGFARISAGMLRVDEADFAEIKDRVGALATANSHWRHSARELLALSSYRAKDFDTAKTYYDELLADQNTPQNLRQRAEMMLSIMVGETASKTTAGEAKADAPESKENDKPASDKE